jgi:hypothetical protein
VWWWRWCWWRAECGACCGVVEVDVTRVAAGVYVAVAGGLAMGEGVVGGVVVRCISRWQGACIVNVMVMRQ